MADATTTAGGDEFPADLPVDGSATPAPESVAPVTTEPAEPEPERPDPRDERIAEMSARLRDQEALNLRMQEEFLRRAQQPVEQPRPEPNPLDNPNLSPEWRESLRFIDQNLTPAIERRLAQKFAPVEQRAAMSEALSERLLLQQAATRDERYADYPAMEPQVLQAQAAAAQQGLRLPLETIYFYVKGMQGGRATPQQVADAEKRGAQRARVAGNASVVTASPAGGASTRGQPLSKEAIAAMSTDQLAALIDSQGWHV